MNEKHILIKNSMFEKLQRLGIPFIDEMFTKLLDELTCGVTSSVLSYKKDSEIKNLKIAIDELNKEYRSLYRSLKKLKDDETDYVEKRIMPIILDNILREEEEKKIKIIINGFESIVENLTKKDIILTYYDILRGLRAIDLEVFAMIKQANDFEKIENNEYVCKYIFNKLEQYNLISIFNPSLISNSDSWKGQPIRVKELVKKYQFNTTELGDEFIKFFKLSVGHPMLYFDSANSNNVN